MGTWGSGNLDNDYALDELSDRSHALVRKLMWRSRRKTSREADEYDYTTLFAEFEIVFAFDAKGLLHCSLPKPEVVEELKWDYISDWDRNIDCLEPSPEHKRKRRQCILRTFNRFKRICTRYHEDA